VLMPKMKLSSTLARDVLMCTKQRTTQWLLAANQTKPE
jgi:hypothetical protein